MFWLRFGRQAAALWPPPPPPTAAIWRLQSTVTAGKARSKPAAFVPPPMELEEPAISALMDLFGLTSDKQVHFMLGAHNKHVLVETGADIRLSHAQLLAHQFTEQAIRRHPKILAKNALTISNHYAVLHEIGLTGISIPALNRFISIINLSPTALKKLGLIAADINMTDRLAQFLGIRVDVSRCADLDPNTTSVKLVRRAVLQAYLGDELGMPAAEMERIWRTYSNLRNKSFRSIREVVQMCQTELHMDKERILAHPYLLYADADNVRQILGQGTLGGMEVRDLLWRRPKIMMSNWRTLVRTQQVIRDFGVPDEAYPSCVEIFTLSPRTIHERLCDLRKIKEFDVLVNHPRVLRLVHYQMKARARLEYLRRMKVNCVSLHVLSSGASSFERYARTGVDRTKGVDVLMLLSQRFGRTQAEIRLVLNKHQNWCHVPAASVKLVLLWLSEERGFSDECIYANCQILLYPLKRIEAQLAALAESRSRWGIAPASISARQQLQMCLYLIELEFHFEGDGIWLEPLSDVSVSAPVVGETELEMLGDYRKTLGPIRTELEGDGGGGGDDELSSMDVGDLLPAETSRRRAEIGALAKR